MADDSAGSKYIFKDLEDNLMLFLTNPERNEAEKASEDDAIATLVTLLDGLEDAGQSRKKVVQDILARKRARTVKDDLARLERQKII